MRGALGGMWTRARMRLMRWMSDDSCSRSLAGGISRRHARHTPHDIFPARTPAQMRCILDQHAHGCDPAYWISKWYTRRTASPFDATTPCLVHLHRSRPGLPATSACGRISGDLLFRGAKLRLLYLPLLTRAGSLYASCEPLGHPINTHHRPTQPTTKRFDTNAKPPLDSNKPKSHHHHHTSHIETARRYPPPPGHLHATCRGRKRDL
ncbi:hypothetical protein FN846DRAFT_598777 [Sphaerosporella brunnea]|uniref:Uncharacterized protein n=1 Tax=Sphaerosporella brunnea TaxID=1250544 RepID=A0A5J5F179_9PEZI|nr:hypothetical protein FN846DRAFT_598777 [Sphaerosporella brunnea]